MKNVEGWSPTKYVRRRGRLMASRDPAEVSIGSRHYTDLVAAMYDKHLSTFARGDLLDLGCGRVPFYQQYRDVVKTVTCADWSNSMHPLEHIDIEVDLNKELPIESATFDTILLSDVIEHISNPELLLSESSRVLRPGGRIIISVPFLYPIHEGPHDYYRYTRFALANLLETRSFELDLLEEIGGAWDVVLDITSKFFLRIPLIGRPLAYLTQWSSVLFEHIPPTRYIRSKTRSTFPEGYFVVATKTSPDE